MRQLREKVGRTFSPPSPSLQVSDFRVFSTDIVVGQPLWLVEAATELEQGGVRVARGGRLGYLAVRRGDALKSHSQGDKVVVTGD